MEALLVKIDLKWREVVYAKEVFCLDGKNDISELIEDSDAKSTKIQIKYVVSRMYLNYDASCLINCSVKSSSLFWYYIKQIMNVFIRAM